AERFRELRNDARAAELREGILARARRDDRTVRERLSRPVVVRDDDVEAARLRTRDLIDGSDPAVDGEDEAAPLVGQPVERLAGDAVALVEAAGQMPVDIRPEPAQADDR